MLVKAAQINRKDLPMADTYISISTIKKSDLTGAATIPKINDKDNWISINSVSFGFGRSISMDVGNVSNAEVGVPGLSEISISHSLDGASPALQSIFFAPGDEGAEIFILMTKTKRTGDGLQPAMEIALKSARLSSYSFGGSGGSGDETITIAYTDITISHFVEDENGKLAAGAKKVGYDLEKAKLTFKAIA